MKIITGLDTIEAVEKTLKFIEDTTDLRWLDGDKPTKFDLKLLIGNYIYIGRIHRIGCCIASCNPQYYSVEKEFPDAEYIDYKTYISQ